MKKIIVIGGVRVNLVGHPFGELMHGTNNPGTISMEYSGTGRNIAVNLKKLGNDVDFISIAGDDICGKMSKIELRELGIGVENFKLVKEFDTATDFQVLNLMDDLELAFGNVDVLKKMDKSFFEPIIEDIKVAEYVVLEGSIAKDGIEYLIEQVGDKLILDPDSPEAAAQLNDIIHKFSMIFPNREEAEKLTGFEILSEEQLNKAGVWFEEKNTKNLFITLAGGGVYYRCNGKEGIVRAKELKPQEHSEGAGAAFVAAVVDGLGKSMDIDELIKYAMAAAEISVETKEIVNNHMSVNEIKKRL